jgi:dTDP-glucose pyrophosphorylase
MKAMILAAGLGTRLRPYTNDRPKALVTLAGRTLLQITLDRLRSFGVSEVIVNAHHYADMILEYLAANQNFGMRIEVSHEEVLLDTGGGLKNSAWFFLDSAGKSDQPFILHNVDVISTIDLASMVRFHNQHAALATLAVQDRETSRYLLFNSQDQLLGRSATRSTIPVNATEELSSMKGTEMTGKEMSTEMKGKEMKGKEKGKEMKGKEKGKEMKGKEKGEEMKGKEMSTEMKGKEMKGKEKGKEMKGKEKSTEMKGTGFSPYINSPESPRALAPEGVFSPTSPAGVHPRAFSGIHVISPRIFTKMTEDGAFSIIDSYLRLANQGEKILAYRSDTSYWRDLGRPESLIETAQDIETGKLAMPQ